MKKISNKISAVIIGCSCLAVLLIGSISIFNARYLVKNDAGETLVWMAQYYASKFSNELIFIENNVKDMQLYVENTINMDILKDDPSYLAEYENYIADYLYDFALKRSHGIAAWCYFNPQLSDSPHDVYYVDGNADGIPERQDYIPFSYYDNTPTATDDKQWWYGPIEKKDIFWTNPYEWTLINNEVIKIVSCAAPVFIDGVFVAVVGTYYRFDEMYKEISAITVYETGRAELFNEKLDVILHPDFFSGTRYTSDNLQTVENGLYADISQQILQADSGLVRFMKKNEADTFLAFSKLSNGWVMAINVIPSELLADVNRLALWLLLSVAGCILFSVIAAWYMGKYIAKPLQAVVRGARLIGAGDLSVKITVDTDDEIKIVADSLNEMVTDTKNLNYELEKLAFVDELTGGYNFHKFKMLAKQTIERNTDSVLYMIRLDIDNFKLINDLFGYQEGNAVLCNMYTIIGNIISSKGIYTRMSDDNFMLLLKYECDDEIVRLDVRFREIFKNVELTRKNGYSITITSGAYKIPFGESNIDKMIDRATMAHRNAKILNNDCKLVFFNDSLRNSILYIKTIEDTMHAALANNEFTVYIQPKYDLKTGVMRGAEALVRWIKDGKVIPPMDFIPIFEKNGFVAKIDTFVLETMCRMQGQWLSEGLSPVPISVNQSKILLFSNGYVQTVCDMTTQYHIPSYLIELELLETVIHDNIDVLKGIIVQLNNLGFLVAIDDFGSGYSSLNMLKDIKANVLKIDREFLNKSEENERGEIVLANIINLAKDLDMSVVAEGVETEKQAEMLRRINCDTAQGYLYAKPMTLLEYDALLRSENASYQTITVSGTKKGV